MKKIFTYFVILFPILSVYYIGISTFTLADLFLFLLIPFLLFNMIKKEKRNVKINIYVFLVIAIIILQSLIYNMLDITDNPALFSAFRIILYYIFIFVFVKEYFDEKEGFEFYKKVSVISSIYFLLQFIMLNVFNKFIPGTLPFLQTSVDEYNSIMSAHKWTSYAYTRSRSFFCEPSHFGVYNSLCLGLMLINEPKKDWKKISIVLISMLLTGSGMSIILTVIILFMWAFKYFTKLSKKKMMVLMTFIVIICVGFPFYAKTNSFQTFYNRTFVEKDSTNGRFGNFIDNFNVRKDTYQIMFGEGIYKIEDIEGQKYITSVPRIYTYFGIIGMISYIFICGCLFIKLKETRLTTWILLFCITFASEILFHNMVMVFLPFLIKNINFNNEEYKKIKE